MQSADDPPDAGDDGELHGGDCQDHGQPAGWGFEFVGLSHAFLVQDFGDDQVGFESANGAALGFCAGYLFLLWFTGRRARVAEEAG